MSGVVKFFFECGDPAPLFLHRGLTRCSKSSAKALSMKAAPGRRTPKKSFADQPIFF